jgi:hypothetical protein
VTKEYRERRLAKEKARTARYTTYHHIADRLVSKMNKTQVQDFGTKLAALIHHAPFVEALYVLDDTGTQVSHLITQAGQADRFASTLSDRPRMGSTIR